MPNVIAPASPPDVWSDLGPFRLLTARLMSRNLSRIAVVLWYARPLGESRRARRSIMRATRVLAVLFTAALCLTLPYAHCTVDAYAVEKRPCTIDPLPPPPPFMYCYSLPGFWVSMAEMIECGPYSVNQTISAFPDFGGWIACQSCIGIACYELPPEEFCECLGSGWYTPGTAPECPAFHQLVSFDFGDRSCETCLLPPCWPNTPAPRPLAIESTWGRVKSTYR
jgi:hypothetical protein